MIKVRVIKENAKYTNVTIKGHANFDDYGKDIVCSAVSSIVTTTVNGILAIDEGSLSFDKKDGLLIIKEINDDKITQTLIENMISLLKDLENDYKENIEVK